MAKKIAHLLSFSIFAMILLTTTVFAHETMSEFWPNPGVNEGVVEFFFDTSDPMYDVEVTVFDLNGEQIAVSRTDERGMLDFTAFSNVGHLIARYDAEHIQIHVVAEGSAYIIGKDFGGTYVSYSQLGELLRSFVLARWWMNIYVIAIPAAIFAVSLIYFIIKKIKFKKMEAA